MTQQADDKELMAAFAEFKQLLQRESEPVGASQAPAVSLAPEANAAALDGAAMEAPRLFAGDAPIARPLANHFAPPPVAPASAAPALDGSEDWSVASFGEGEAVVAENEPSGGRRKLVYLSLAVVAIGVASLGWTLTKWRPAEDPVADLSLPAEPEAQAPGASDAALEPPAAEPAKDAALAVEAPTTDKAELTPPQAIEAPALGQPQPAAAPAPETAASLPEPAAPPPAPAPRRVEAVSAPPAASEAVAPAAAAAAAGAAIAPLASTGAGAGRLTPPAAPRTAALPPANRFTPPESAAPAAHPAPKPPAPAKVAKPKPIPTPAAAKHAKPHPGPAERAPVASAAPVAAAPEPAAPPPAAPQTEGGPFGFMKRTLNSVGSTISGVTRSVIP